MPCSRSVSRGVEPALVVDDVPQMGSRRRHGGVEQGLEVVEFFGRFEHRPSPAPRCSGRSAACDAGAMADGTATDHSGEHGGRGAVVPILVYEDIEAGHDDLVSTFGFTSGGLHRDDDGVVVHGEVRMGDGVVWLHRVTPEREMLSPRGGEVCMAGCRSSSPTWTLTSTRRGGGCPHRAGADRPGLRPARVRRPRRGGPPVVVRFPAGGLNHPRPADATTLSTMAAVSMPRNLAAASRAGALATHGCARLPAQIAALADRWSLRLGEPFEPGGQTAWVAPVDSAAHGAAVLKVGWRHMEAEDEAAGLRAWHGEGAIRVFAEERVDQTTALLLERCVPGTTLAERPEDQQDHVDRHRSPPPVARTSRRRRLPPAPSHVRLLGRFLRTQAGGRQHGGGSRPRPGRCRPLPRVTRLRHRRGVALHRPAR